MRQIQNRDNQACNSNDNHKLFVCTHKHPLLCKTQGEECSRPTGCRGKYIICASAILRAGGAGEGHLLRWKAAIGERKIAFGSVYSHLLSSFIRSISCCRPSGVISTSMRSCAAITSSGSCAMLVSSGSGADEVSSGEGALLAISFWYSGILVKSSICSIALFCPASVN